MTPKAKNILLVIMAALIILLVIILVHNKPPTGMRPPPPGSEDKGFERTTEGLVKEFGNNPMGDIDKLLLQQNDGGLWLHFPPHTARQVLAIAKKNEHVTLVIHQGNGHAGNGKHGFEIVSLVNDKGEAFDVKNVPPPMPTPGILINVEGTSAKLNTDNENHVMSMTLADKIIVLPGHLQESLLPLLSHAHHIMVQGIERDATDGFVSKSGLNLVKPIAITIDSVKYTIE